MFSKLDIVPRWIIFAIDLGLSIFALCLAKFLRYEFKLDEIDAPSFLQSILALIAINMLVFYTLRMHAGIVRYTSSQDSFRILFSVLVSSSSLFFLNSLVLLFGGRGFISLVSLIIYSLISFVLLISYRILIKYFFMYIKKASQKQVRVLIYGAGEAGLATKRVFDHDPGVNKQVVAYVDDDPRKIGKLIEGIMIYNAATLEELNIRHKIDELVFASYTIPLERKNHVVDFCLAQNVKVLNIPAHEAWEQGEVKSAQIQHIHIEDLLDRPTIQIAIESIQEELKGKTILITGAAGSIGSEIVRQLVKFNTGKIVMCDQSETALHHLALEMAERKGCENCLAFIGDVRDPKRMLSLFRRFKPHYVYHAAAYKHVPMMEDNPAEAIKTNVLGTKILADLSVRYGVEKFVMVSTDKAVNPTNVMGASKRIAEIYVQSLNNSLNSAATGFTRFITTRFGNVLGSNGSVIPRFKQQIERGGPVTVTHPEITRYFMTIPEACRLVLEAGCMGRGGEIFVFDMGKSVKIIDLAKRMIRLAGLVPDKDIAITYSGLRPGEKLYEELLNDLENALPTHHHKIKIGKVREYLFDEVEGQIAALGICAQDIDQDAVVKQMKAIVPEFKSKNSRFEALDQENVIVNNFYSS